MVQKPKTDAAIRRGAVTAAWKREAPRDVHLVPPRDVTERPPTPPKGMRRVSRTLVPPAPPTAMPLGTDPEAPTLPPPPMMPDFAPPASGFTTLDIPDIERPPTLPPGFTMAPPPPAARATSAEGLRPSTRPERSNAPNSTMLPPRRSTLRPAEGASHLRDTSPPPSLAHDSAGALVAKLAVSSRAELDAAEAFALAQRIGTFGEIGLEVLCQAFPGPTFDAPGTLPASAAETSGVAGALARQGEVAVPYVAWLLGSHDATQRRCAAIVARELPHPDLVKPLGRLLLDTERETRDAAVSALVEHQRFPEHRELVHALTSAATDPTTRQVWRLRSLKAIRDIRATETTERLIGLLTDRVPEVARTAHGALRVLTGHDFGRIRSAWQAWYGRNAANTRRAWLRAALADSRTDIRQLATEELVALGPEVD